MFLPKLQIIVDADCLWKRYSLRSRNMKLLIALVILGTVAADVSHLGSQYLPPKEAQIQTEYLPPIPAQQYGLPPVVAQPAPEYGPPASVQSVLSEPQSLDYIPPEPTAPKYIPPATPAPSYIPPETQQAQYIPPVPVTPEYIPPAVSTVSADSAPKYIPPAPVFETSNEGYTYRTVKRIKYRNRS